MIKSILIPEHSAKYLHAEVQKLAFKSKDQKDTVLHHLNHLSTDKKGIFLTEAKATEITEALIYAYANIQIHSYHEHKLINTLNRLSDELYNSIKGKQND